MVQQGKVGSSHFRFQGCSPFSSEAGLIITYALSQRQESVDSIQLSKFACKNNHPHLTAAEVACSLLPAISRSRVSPQRAPHSPQGSKCSLLPASVFLWSPVSPAPRSRSNQCCRALRPALFFLLFLWKSPSLVTNVACCLWEGVGAFRCFLFGFLGLCFQIST